MEVLRKNFPTLMLDNDQIFIDNLCAVVESVDELSSMEIVKTPFHYHFRIAPSIPKYIEPILQEILQFNNIFGFHLDLGKSMKTSSTVTFNIEIL